MVQQLVMDFETHKSTPKPAPAAAKSIFLYDYRRDGELKEGESILVFDDGHTIKKGAR